MYLKIIVVAELIGQAIVADNSNLDVPIDYKFYGYGKITCF